jgi:hypothetical protein
MNLQVMFLLCTMMLLMFMKKKSRKSFKNGIKGFDKTGIIASD